MESALEMPVMPKITKTAHMAIYLSLSKAMIAFFEILLPVEYGAISPEYCHKRENATHFKQVAFAILDQLTSATNTGSTVHLCD